MKHLNSFLTLAIFSFFLVSCTLDSDDTSLDLTAEISTSIKTQKANADFDYSKKGIYHGIFTSGLAQSNGMVWINIGNDESYSAIVELSNGKEYDFEMLNSIDDETDSTSYEFVNEVGSFVLDVSNPSSPLLKDATLNDLVHLAKIVKNTSQSRAMSKTGTFTGSISGTWNLMYDETTTIPNQGNTNPLIDVVVAYTINAVPFMRTDNVFEPVAFGVNCVHSAAFIAYNGSHIGAANPKDMGALNQSSLFGNTYPTLWSVQHENATVVGVDSYISGCDYAASGFWSRPVPGAPTESGLIFID